MMRPLVPQRVLPFLDPCRPLGSFLTEFEYYPDGDWNLYGLSPLREALHSNRCKQPALEQTAGGFLREKIDSGDPLRMYVAFRIWNDDLIAREPRDREATCQRFMDRMSVPSEETWLDLWYPDNRRMTECVAAYVSFYPLVTYCLNRLNDWEQPELAKQDQ